MRKIDIATWNRKEHFEFFTQFDQPFYGIVTEVDVTNAMAFCKANKVSFFAHYMHQSMLAVNQVEALKMRIVDNEVLVFDEIHLGSAIGRKDGTFGYAFAPHHPNFEIFNEGLQAAIEHIQNTQGINANASTQRQDLIRYSTIPWVNFTGLTHATSFGTGNSIPMITFGKVTETNGKKTMPVAVDVHHGLVDGFHIGQYVEAFQELLN